MAFGYNYCAPVADVEITELDLDAGDVCSAVLSDVAKTGPKDCGASTTPSLSWAGVSIFSDDLPADLTFDIDVWAGVEDRGGAKCLWFGSEAYKFCIPPDDCQIVDGEISYEALKDGVGSLITSLEGEQSGFDNALKTIGTVFIIGVVVAAVAYILIELLPFAVVGAVGAGVAGGAAILSSVPRKAG